MPRLATVFDILISSPDDVKDDRIRVKEAIHRWNAINSRKFKVILEPAMWETHSISEMGDRPQALLNKQLVENRDILIALFWKRFGTPTGAEPSGTVEEIKKFREGGKPVIVYFSTKPNTPTNVEDQIEKVDEYKKTLRDEGLCFEFSSDEELDRLLERDISGTVTSLLKRNLFTSADDTKLSEFKKVFDRLSNFYERLNIEWNASSLDDITQPIDNIEESRKMRPILDRARDELWEIHGQLNYPELNDVQGKIKTVLFHIEDLMKNTNLDNLPFEKRSKISEKLKREPQYLMHKRIEITSLLENAVRDFKNIFEKNVN
jgi:hypothetical protein